jgi:hypothetical protein
MKAHDGWRRWGRCVKVQPQVDGTVEGGATAQRAAVGAGASKQKMPLSRPMQKKRGRWAFMALSGGRWGASQRFVLAVLCSLVVVRGPHLRSPHTSVPHVAPYVANTRCWVHEGGTAAIWDTTSSRDQLLSLCLSHRVLRSVHGGWWRRWERRRCCTWGWRRQRSGGTTRHSCNAPPHYISSHCCRTWTSYSSSRCCPSYTVICWMRIG